MFEVQNYLKRSMMSRWQIQREKKLHLEMENSLMRRKCVCVLCVHLESVCLSVCLFLCLSGWRPKKCQWSIAGYHEIEKSEVTCGSSKGKNAFVRLGIEKQLVRLFKKYTEIGLEKNAFNPGKKYIGKFLVCTGM